MNRSSQGPRAALLRWSAPRFRMPGGHRFRGARLRCPLSVLIGMTGLLMLSACASFPVPDRLSGGVGGSIGWQEVAMKYEPNTLATIDGKECVVPRERYQRIARGNRVFCHWRDGSGPTRRGPGSR